LLSVQVQSASGQTPSFDSELHARYGFSVKYAMPCSGVGGVMGWAKERKEMRERKGAEGSGRERKGAEGSGRGVRE
jgi:hypothetical protein